MQHKRNDEQIGIACVLGTCFVQHKSNDEQIEITVIVSRLVYIQHRREGTHLIGIGCSGLQSRVGTAGTWRDN